MKTVYSDPTANIAIANVMREERRKDRLKDKEKRERENAGQAGRGADDKRRERK